MAGHDDARRLGWLGTGRMGVEMGRRLLSAGCDLAVFNRSMGKAEPLIRLGAKPAQNRRGTGDQGYRLHHRRLIG